MSSIPGRLAVYHISYPMFIQSTNTWVLSGFSQYNMARRKNCVEKKRKSKFCQSSGHEKLGTIITTIIWFGDTVTVSHLTSSFVCHSSPLPVISTPLANLVFFSLFVPYLIPNPTRFLYNEEPSSFNSI